jgi:hypothetical protein
MSDCNFAKKTLKSRFNESFSSLLLAYRIEDDVSIDEELVYLINLKQTFEKK